MRLILARHGVTFAPGAPAVWLGGAADPPLTATGRLQAQAVGRCVAAAQVPIAAIYASHLCRASEFSRIAAAEFSPNLGPPQTNDALGEIDYGRWAGRSRAEVLASKPDATAALQAWEHLAAYPAGAGFAPAEKVVRAQWLAWLNGLAQAFPHEAATVLAVSHHGRLRQLHRMLQPPLIQPEGQAANARRAGSAPVAKMRCGYLAVLESMAPVQSPPNSACAPASWRIRAWDIAPDAAVLAQLLAGAEPLG